MVIPASSAATKLTGDIRIKMKIAHRNQIDVTKESISRNIVFLPIFDESAKNIVQKF